MLSSHTAYNFVALYVLPGMHFIEAYFLIFYATKRFLSAVEITCISVASSKFLALNSLIPYLGKIIFRASDWTAAPAKKPELGS